MEYECLTHNACRGRKSVYLSRRDIYDVFARAITAAGHKVPAGVVLVEHTDIMRRTDGKYVKEWGFLFKILGHDDGHLHIWSFGRAETLTLIKEYMTEKNYAAVTEPFSPVVALPAAGMTLWL